MFSHRAHQVRSSSRNFKNTSTYLTMYTCTVYLALLGFANLITAGQPTYGDVVPEYVTRETWRA
jgi:uncharacterized membrane protein YkvI